MAKRKTSKPKKSKANHPVASKATRKRLTKELKNARARIRGMMESMGGDYSGPALEDFYLNTILDKIKSGVHINTIYAMIRNTNAKKIRAQKAKEKITDPYVANLYGGSPIKQSTYSKVYKAVAKANKNIKDAKDRMPEAESIFPGLLSVEEVLNKVTTEKKLLDLVRAIKSSFVPEKLYPVAINDEGEGGTQAELDYLKYFVENENKKREKGREELKDTMKSKGFFRTQQEFDVKDIDTSTWNTLGKWRTRADYLTDAQDYVRAGRWLANYSNELDRLMDLLKNDRGMLDDSEYQEELRIIKDILERIQDPDTVRALTRYSPNIGIQELYISGLSEVTAQIDYLFNDWINFEANYL